MNRLATRVAVLTACWSAALDPALAGESIFKQGGGRTRTRTESCAKPIYAFVEDKVLGKKIEAFNEEMDDFFAAQEEWGTLVMSGLLLAPPFFIGPDKKEYNPFGIDADKKFADWFAEAGKAEGNVRFTERIFNSLNAAGTFQFAPEQAALARSVFERQSVDQQIFQDRLQRNQILERASLEDFRNNRAAAAEARQLRIERTRSVATRATDARNEAEAVRAASERAAAEKNRQVREKNEALRKAKAGGVQADIDKAQAELNNATEDASRAQDVYKRANADLKSRSDEEAAAMKAQEDALAAPINTGNLPDSTVTAPATFPTFGAQGQNFQFQSYIEPGSTIAAAKTFTSGLPTVTPMNVDALGDKALPELERNKDDVSAFPARARLIDAAGNMTIMKIFNFLGNPQAALQFEDKPIAMAVGTIAVNPGWRTRQEYDGQIDVASSYAWQAARPETLRRMLEYKDSFHDDDERNLAKDFLANGSWSPLGFRQEYRDNYCRSKDTRITPVSCAVSPLMERQNLDEASSRARQDEVALFLSASLARSGQKAAGDIFNKYVKLRRLDVATRSSLPVVNAYGLAGNRFGFNVTSRLTAVGDATRRPKATNLLEKQSFPILVVFGFSHDDLRPRIVWVDGHAEIWEPALSFAQTHRWGRQIKRGAFHEVLHSVAFPGFPGRPMNAPSETYELMLRVGRKKDELDLAFSKLNYPLSDSLAAYKALYTSQYGLLDQARGSLTTLDIPVEYLVGAPKKKEEPAPVAPTIFDVFPRQLELRQGVAVGGASEFQADVVVVGTGFDQLDQGLITVDSTARSAGINLRTLPPGFDNKKAMALTLHFSDPVREFQFQFPFKVERPMAKEGEAAPPPPPPTRFLYSPTIRAVQAFVGFRDDTRIVSVFPPRFDIQRTANDQDFAVRNIDLFVQTNRISAVGLKQAQAVLRTKLPVFPAPGAAAPAEKPSIARVLEAYPNEGNENVYLVRVELSLSPSFRAGDLTLELDPVTLLGGGAVPSANGLQSAPVSIVAESKP